MICFHFIQGIALYYRGSFINLNAVNLRYLLVNISICINFRYTVAFLLACNNVTHITHAYKCDTENIPFLHSKKTIFGIISALFLRS